MEKIIADMDDILSGGSAVVPREDKTNKRKKLVVTTEGGFAIDCRHQRLIGEMTLMSKVCKALYDNPMEWDIFHDQTVDEGHRILDEWRLGLDDLMLGVMDRLFRPDFEICDNREVVALPPPATPPSPIIQRE